MNDLQKKVFELLEVFVGICDKWNIPYYLVCGSALGAVKYGGFIPWDDDIDVGLLREDYQRFLELAPKELPQWCFLQNYKTDRAFPHTFTKLRNSETTFIEDSVAELPINLGIYLDIFPIDGHPAGKLEKFRFSVIKKWNDWIRFCVLQERTNTRVKFRNQIMRILGFQNRIFQAQEHLEKLYCSYPPRMSELWCNYGNWQGSLEYAPREHYAEGVQATFEGMSVRIPGAYDAYLTQKYGDWRSDLPVERQKSHHMGIIIDTQRSYKEYVGERRGKIGR